MRKMLSTGKISTIGLLACAAAGALISQTSISEVPFVVRGSVTGGADIEILLLDEAGSPAARTVSGRGGQFQLSTLRAGPYQLAVRRDGQTEVHDTVHLSSRQPVVTVQLGVHPPFAIREATVSSGDYRIDARRLARPIPVAARRLYEQALRLEQKGDQAGAMARLEKAVSQAPEYIEALNNLAVLYRRHSWGAKAEQILRRSLELDRAAWRPHLNLGLVLLDRQAFPEALEKLEAAYRLSPDSALPAFHLGRLHLLETRFQRAEASFGQALERQPDFAVARLFRGYARVAAGRVAEGRADLVAYLETSPSAADAATVRKQLEQIGGAVGSGGTR